MASAREGRYGRISESFWDDPVVRGLPGDAVLVECYLRTAKHRNRLGLYVLDPLYAAGDLKWSEERVGQALAALDAARRIAWDRDNRVVFVLDVLEQESLANPNVVTAAVRDLAGVPATPLLRDLLAVVEANQRPHYDELLTAIRKRVDEEPTRHEGKALPNRYTKGLVKRLAKGYADNAETQTLPTLPEPSINHPNPITTESVEFNTADEVWAAVRECILNDWHGGEDEIVVKGKQETMANEERRVQMLVREYEAEETYRAIMAGPEALGMQEPCSLRLFTNEKTGPANFSNAVGQWHKRL